MVRRIGIVLSFLLAASPVFAEGPAEQPVVHAPKAAAPPLASLSTDSGSLLQRTLSGMTICGLTLLALAGGWKKYAEKQGLTNTNNQIEVLARRGLSQKTGLVIVRVDGRRYFLAQGAESVTLISELDDPMLFGASGALETDDTAEIHRLARRAHES